MAWLTDFSIRSHQSEMMGNSKVDDKRVYRTLSQFKIINLLFSRSRKLMKDILIPHMLQAGKTKIALLDIGAGGGDIAIWFSRLCRSRGIDIEILCLDSDPKVVKYARKKCRHVNNVTVRLGLVDDIEALDMNVDYIFANHLLHHLRDQDIHRFLKRVYKNARRGFLINDLVRSPLAYLGFTLFAGGFLHGSYHFHDGRISIKKGFKPQEIEEVIVKSELTGIVKLGQLIPARAFVYCLKDN